MYDILACSNSSLVLVELDFITRFKRERVLSHSASDDGIDETLSLKSANCLKKGLYERMDHISSSVFSLHSGRFKAFKDLVIHTMYASCI